MKTKAEVGISVLTYLLHKHAQRLRSVLDFITLCNFEK